MTAPLSAEETTAPAPAGQVLLALLGVDPGDVVRVVTSHFHYDHIGHMRLFPRAEVVAAREEHGYWTDLRDRAGLDGEFATVEDLGEVERAREEGRLTLVDGPTRVAEHLTVIPAGGLHPAVEGPAGQVAVVLG